MQRNDLTIGQRHVHAKRRGHAPSKRVTLRASNPLLVRSAQLQLPVHFVVLGAQLRHDHRVLVERFLQLESDALPRDRAVVEVRAQGELARLLQAARHGGDVSQPRGSNPVHPVPGQHRIDCVGQIADGRPHVRQDAQVRSERSSKRLRIVADMHGAARPARRQTAHVFPADAAPRTLSRDEELALPAPLDGFHVMVRRFFE